MEFTIRQIATLLNGTTSGDDSLKISRVSKIEEGGAGSISFLSNLKYEPYLYTTASSAVIVDKSFQPKQSVQATLIFVDNSYSAFTQLLEEVNRRLKEGRSGVEQPSFAGAGTSFGEGGYRGAFSYVGDNCRIGSNVRIYPQAYIGNNVSIGDNTIIYAGVRIYDNTVIGRDCVLHAGAVIGSDGFGFAPQADGTYRTIPQLGNVVIEDNVSVGANTTIDCATMGSTIIRQGVKLDNLIQVGHNVEIGRNTVIAAQTGIAGSTKLGDNCVIGGQVGFAGHLVLASGTKVGAQSGVGKSIKEEGVSLNGSPATELSENMRSLAVFRKLPSLEKRVSLLEKNHRNQYGSEVPANGKVS
ncbi:UDP-3-O-(3-hydroxymyristoyl)glucosamine N-acyltransferase [Tellurirhabdus rosea]|uniref:UDP-3-O-(3-hydroxymyristoyl)glucosamine N-acyltransferase n=1 Tax=Tellurirhabdus rosea TaxID=2674997 RepID=UPI002251108E|nr:UDP-3-O-(3-hydroxymyristoyl)glucosamine N-acyltransferase [Tellurirhabdus rosea]